MYMVDQDDRQASMEMLELKTCSIFITIITLEIHPWTVSLQHHIQTHISLTLISYIIHVLLDEGFPPPVPPDHVELEPHELSRDGPALFTVTPQHCTPIGLLG